MGVTSVMGEVKIFAAGIALTACAVCVLGLIVYAMIVIEEVIGGPLAVVAVSALVAVIAAAVWRFAHWRECGL